MKQKFKNYLKLGVLLFGISFMPISCEKDFEPEVIDNNNQSKLTIQKGIKPDLSNNRTLLRKIEGINKKARFANISSREVYNAEMDFYVDTEIANYIEYGEYHSYTFPVYRDEDNGLIENLFLSLQVDGSYKSVLTQYNLTDEEIENYKNGINIDLNGKIEGIVIDDIELTNNILSNSRSSDCYVDTVEDKYCKNYYGEVIPWNGDNNGDQENECWGTWSYTVTTYYFSAGCSNTGGGTGSGSGSGTGTGDGTNASGSTGTGGGGTTNDNNSEDNGTTGGNEDSLDDCLQPTDDGSCFDDTGVLIIPDKDPEDTCKNSASTITRLNALMNNTQIKGGMTGLEEHLAAGTQTEAGKEFILNDDGITYTPVDPILISADETEFPDPVLKSRIRMHVHHSGLNPIPSWEDTYLAFPIYYKATLSNDIVHFTLTENGLYAFTVNNSSSLSNLYDGVYVERDEDGNPVNPDDPNLYKQDLLRNSERYNETQAKKNSNSEEEYHLNLEKGFVSQMKFMNKYYPGATGLYKATKIGDNYVWECINLKKD